MKLLQPSPDGEWYCGVRDLVTGRLRPEDRVDSNSMVRAPFAVEIRNAIAVCPCVKMDVSTIASDAFLST